LILFLLLFIVIIIIILYYFQYLVQVTVVLMTALGRPSIWTRVRRDVTISLPTSHQSGPRLLPKCQSIEFGWYTSLILEGEVDETDDGMAPAPDTPTTPPLERIIMDLISQFPSLTRLVIGPCLGPVLDDLALTRILDACGSRIGMPFTLQY
jgi:hypothetical protein